jgi:hypothetical protein
LAWLKKSGNPEPDVLMFPGTGKDGYVRGSFLSRGVLYPAMDKAGIEREHKATGTKRTWHSLRHTYARVCIEAGLGLKQL